jgi:hypothetical protein
MQATLNEYDDQREKAVQNIMDIVIEGLDRSNPGLTVVELETRIRAVIKGLG